MLAWFLYINYTYSIPERGVDCIEEMQKCKESSNSVYTYFGGMLLSMRCKNYMVCRNITREPHLKCWREWQLCGMCATKKHPEEYDDRVRKRWNIKDLKIRNCRNARKYYHK